eukprot:GEMP01022173.1.p1 GENE.GEMP01022173.1~~GEMP01022173.1.p1  ORF type:complete len:462 (+),score=112.13 GEMP01022173.1:389-1774(+)
MKMTSQRKTWLRFRQAVRDCPESTLDMACVCEGNKQVLFSRCRRAVQDMNGVKVKSTTPWMRCDNGGTFVDRQEKVGVTPGGKFVCALNEATNFPDTTAPPPLPGRNPKARMKPHFRELMYNYGKPEQAHIYDHCAKCAHSPITETAAASPNYTKLFDTPSALKKKPRTYNDIRPMRADVAQCPLGRLQIRCRCSERSDLSGLPVLAESYSARCVEDAKGDVSKTEWLRCLPPPYSTFLRGYGTRAGAAVCAFPFGAHFDANGTDTLLARKMILPYDYYKKTSGPDMRVLDQCANRCEGVFGFTGGARRIKWVNNVKDYPAIQRENKPGEEEGSGQQNAAMLNHSPRGATPANDLRMPQMGKLVPPNLEDVDVDDITGSVSFVPAHSNVSHSGSVAAAGDNAGMAGAAGNNAGTMGAAGGNVSMAVTEQAIIPIDISLSLFWVWRYLCRPSKLVTSPEDFL